jgi:transglutaminase-like putative cysteine protease
MDGLRTDQEMKSESNRSRWWDLLAAIFLLAAVFTAGSRLDATGWSKGLSLVPYVIIFGTLTGLALGKSRFNAKLVGLFGLIYGLYFVTWQLGSTLVNNLPWKERLLSIANRAAGIIAQIKDRQSVSDSILFILLMAILFWILSLLAGYVLTRHGNAWWAIIPIGIVLFTIHAFDSVVSRKALYLAVFLFFSLVLIARMTYLHQQRRWIQSRTALPPHLGMDFIRYTLAVVMIVVIIAWTAPALAKTIPAVVEASQPLRQSWSELRSRWENAFTSLRSTIRVYTDYYGDNVSLGRGSKLTDTPTLMITPPESPPLVVRYYWRGYVYDNYAAGKWSNTVFEQQEFDPQIDTLELSEYQGRWENSFEFQPTIYLTSLYAPSQPSWVSPDARVSLATNLDGTVDIEGFHAVNPVRPQQSYQVQSSISIATINQLRQSGTEYPDWVKQRYLKLPDTITPRTRQLAEDITAEIGNPYDKVVAITNYLRDNIQYQETIPPVPRGKEPVDWFLFDLRQGFCNYYATAEVVLLRSIGIPARWAIGYAQGERLEDGRYLVRQRDAHSWPEVFFPELGWVEFEPTVTQPDILRLSGETKDSTSNNDMTEAELELLRREELEALRQQHENFTPSPPSPAQPKWPLTILWLAVAGVLIGSGYIIWRNRGRFTLPPLPILIETTLIKIGIQPPRAIRHWAKRAALPPLSKSYLEIIKALKRLGEAIRPTDTPAERAQKLGEILPSANEPAQVLLNEYQIAMFSQETGDYDMARQAAYEIRALSLKASFTNLGNKLKKPTAGKRTNLRNRNVKS